MHVLAFNCGSSSIKCAVVDVASGTRVSELRIENVGREDPQLAIGQTGQKLRSGLNFASAVDAVMAELRNRWVQFGKIDAVVHRMVHGGARFTAPTLIEADVVTQLAELERLAPLHNPPAMQAIRGARELFANIPHVAIFDTAFHTTLPTRAREYALPAEVRARFGIRRFDFHGISHGDVAARAATHLGKPAQEMRIISCHLGSGASVTAIEYGRPPEG